MIKKFTCYPKENASKENETAVMNKKEENNQKDKN